MNKKPVPFATISKVLDEVMEKAVENGADSRSMPDEYVEVAHFVCYPQSYSLNPVAEILIDAALNHYYQYMCEATSAMAQKTFRLPSGRKVSDDEINQAFARKDVIRNLIEQRSKS